MWYRLGLQTSGELTWLEPPSCVISCDSVTPGLSGDSQATLCLFRTSLAPSDLPTPSLPGQLGFLRAPGLSEVGSGKLSFALGPGLAYSVGGNSPQANPDSTGGKADASP